EEAGHLLDVIRKYGPEKSILGVCLGQQAIAEVYGGSLFNLEKPVHGTATEMHITDHSEILFRGLPEHFMVGRYHSWAVTPEDLPPVLKTAALDQQQVIMALAHTQYDVKGVQFHPESVLSEHGKTIIQNWLNN